MGGTERNRTEREVILEPRTKPLASLGELTEACLPTLTARLWATCCWPATMAGAWKIGDHNFLIAEVCPDPETCLYVQFWSEPHEPVVAEVCSGEWNPGAVQYIRQHERDGLGALGYMEGGRAHNFRKELPIRTSAEAETVAREVLDIFFEVFGYRGQWPLELTWHRGERAGHAPVYSSVTPADFVKLAAHLGFESEVGAGREPVVPMRHGKRPFLASFSGRIGDESLYSIVVLEAALTSPGVLDDASIERINDTLRFARLSRAGEQAFVLSMPLRLDGGVTVGWLANALQHWLAAWRGCERLSKGRRAVRAPQAKRRRAADPTVH